MALASHKRDPMKIAEADILVVPGLGNSGPGHWQRRWAERLPTGRFVDQDDWNHPLLEDWVGTLQREIMLATNPVVLIAHSLGVLNVVHTAGRLADTKVRGAFLVSAPDPEGEAFPLEAREFGPTPRNPLPFPSMLLASTTDPICTLERAADMAAAWGSDFHVAGDAGHINAASGHGPWPEGLMQFSRLMRRLKS
jgi:predicted alpha/beta hydrolase family esterase